MDLKSMFEEGQQLIRNRRFDEAAELYNKLIENSEHDEKIHYWSIKHLGDIVGFLHYKDYFRAVDLYQKVIMDYEGEDGLYEWCQVDMSKTYLLAGVEMFETFENMVDMLQPINDQMAEYIHKMNEKREDFLTTRAEEIYKKRM